MMATTSNPPAEMATQEAVTKSEFKVKGLPPGWRREVVVRKNGQSAGKTDVYYYSPCGKKFRSKPQIARFLGDHADLTVFDFSRAGTPGDGSSRRRARDRSTRRAAEVAKQGPPPVRPLSINPLRPSGPIRRTCGVIKLPVTWVPPPCEDELKMSAAVKLQEAAMAKATADLLPVVPPLLVPGFPVPVAAAALPPPMTAGQGERSTPNQAKPADQPRPPPPLLQPQLQLPLPQLAQQPQLHQQPQLPQQPQPQLPLPPPTSVVMVPALWENRLRGVLAYDYETGKAIKISPEKLPNGWGASSNGASSSNGAPSSTAATKGAGPETKETPSLVGKSALSSLLNKKVIQQVAKIEDKKHLSASLSAGNVVPSLLAHGKNAPKLSAAMGVPSSLRTIQENGSLISQQKNFPGSNIVFTLPTMASASAYKSSGSSSGGGAAGGGSSIATMAPPQRQTLRAPVVPSHTLKPATASSQGSSPGLYVSESELRRQEEKVQLIRKQLMAAQSSV